MMDEDFLTNTLDVFIRYGFRKTSMDDIAQAVGLSRQAIYKRFGNKEALFKAVIDASIVQYFEDATAAIRKEDLSVSERFYEANACTAGEFVDKLRSSPHSHEVIAMANMEGHDLAAELDAKFQEEAAELLLRENVFTNKDDALDAVFVIDSASKGLLHEAKNQQEYCDGIRRVVRCVLP